MTAVLHTPPWWTAYVDLLVELGTGTHHNLNTVGQWDRAQWDNQASGTWSGLEPDWIPVDPCNLLDVATTRGRDRWTDRFEASSASFSVQDPEGRLSWDAAATDDQLEVRPGREVRIQARLVADGTTWPVWRGWVETIGDQFAPASVPVAQFTAQDGYAQLAHIDLLEQTPVGAGELSSARIVRLLDLAAWPAAWRDIEPGRVTVQATNLARPIADDLGITADSEGGAVYAGTDGRITFRNRDWIRTNPLATTVQATVGGPGEDVCAASFEITRDAGDVVNDVQVSRAEGTVQRYTDETSISIYRHRTYQRTDYICESDEQVGVLGRRILTARAAGQVRMPRLTIKPTDDVATWRFVLAVDFGWRIEVHYGTDWARELLVQGVAHRITPTGWETELRVDDVTPGAADTWDGEHGWDRALWMEVT